MMRKLMRKQKGFTLIELLIVVAIIGIIAALLIPNFLESLQKAKQKRTMADARNGGTAMMAWLTDEAGAAAAGATANMASYASGNDGFTNTYSEVETILVPDYMNQLPAIDGWKKFFQYALNTGNPLAVRVMAIYSGGRDGTQAQDGWETTITPASVGPYDPTSYDNDILWADGSFVVWPEKLN